MLWMRMKTVMNSWCGWKWRLPCSVWLAVLFTVGGLILLIHQQAISEIVLQQFPGMKQRSTSHLSTEDPELYGRNRQPPISEAPDQTVDSVYVTKGQSTNLKTSSLVHDKKNNLSLSVGSSLSSAPLLSKSSGFSSVASFSLERWRKITSLLEARKKLIKATCVKYFGGVSKTIARQHLSSIFVEDKYKLLYCEVPKAGCSNWKRTLMVLAGHASNTDSITHEKVHYSNLLKRLNTFDQEGIKYRLQTYIKVMFVREPLQRMVSAYRDKFENPNPYYHGLFGKPIIAKYRKNPSKESLITGDGVTFNEFVKYLLDIGQAAQTDIHWDQTNHLCHPCLINYNFIGKFENMEEESSYLLRLVGAPPKLRVPTFKDRNPNEPKTSLQIAESYFSQVSDVERQGVYNFYHLDYLMFNYSKPFEDLH